MIPWQRAARIDDVIGFETFGLFQERGVDDRDARHDIDLVESDAPAVGAEVAVDGLATVARLAVGTVLARHLDGCGWKPHGGETSGGSLAAVHALAETLEDRVAGHFEFQRATKA